MAVFIHHLFITIFTFTVTKFKIIIEFFATIFAFFHTLFLHNFRFVTNMISYFFLNYIHLILIHCHSFCFCNQHPLALLLQGFLCIFINRIDLIYLDFFASRSKWSKTSFHIWTEHTHFSSMKLLLIIIKNRRPFKIFHFINKSLYKAIYPAHF